MEQKVRKGRRIKRKTVNKILINVVLAISLVLVLMPLVFMFFSSFKTFEDAITHTASLFPHEWTFGNFTTVFKEFPFLRYLGNSIFVTVMACIGTTLSSALVAYGFARFQVKIKNFIFLLMLATIFIPGQVLQIPLFEMYREFHWFNTYLPFIVPAFLGGGIVNVFLIRNFFAALSKEFFESAQLDGASELRIFAQIVIPLAMPIILTVAIFSFVGNWNDFYSPLLYLTDDMKYTLAYGLYITFDKFKVAGQTAWNLICASNLVVILPIIVLYFLCQKYFVEGITVGGVKG